MFSAPPRENGFKNNDLYFEEAIADSLAGDFDVVESPLSRSAFRLVLGAAALLGLAAAVWTAVLNAEGGGFFISTARRRI